MSVPKLRFPFGEGHAFALSAPENPEPRWPAIAAGLAIGGLYTALPQHLMIGPRWLLLSIVCVLLGPLVLSRWKGHHNANQIFGFLLSGIITLFLITSVVLLIASLPTHRESPVMLLRSAAALWATNVLVFASWYWRLDAGGPHMRDMRGCHTDGAFLFPQMTMDDELRAQTGYWSPQFADYLFLAFNASTALSPADTAVLSRWAKLLMMIQSLISLTVIALLAARAVNIL